MMLQRLMWLFSFLFLNMHASEVQQSSAEKLKQADHLQEMYKKEWLHSLGLTDKADYADQLQAFVNQNYQEGKSIDRILNLFQAHFFAGEESSNRQKRAERDINLLVKSYKQSSRYREQKACQRSVSQ